MRKLIAHVGSLLLLAASPAVAQAPSPVAPQPIAGAGTWVLLPNASGPKQCSARVSGEDVDVTLQIDSHQKMILVASRPDWSSEGEPSDFTLQIDAAPAVSMKGDGIANMFLSTPDDDISARLKKANDLIWRLPWGEFHAHVTGLDKAFEALKACDGIPH